MANWPGIVLMAGNARPLEDLLVDQVTYMGITGKQLENAKAIQANVKKLEKGDEDSPSLVGVPASYWLDLKGLRSRRRGQETRNSHADPAG